MKKEFLTILLLLLLPATQFLKAQNDSLHKKLIRINSVSLAFGPLYDQPTEVGLEHFKAMAPYDSLTNIDLSPYTKSKNKSDISTFLNVSFGFNRLNKNTNQYYLQREHRIGLRFYSNDLLPLKYNRKTTLIVDTLNYKGKDYYNVTVDSSTNFYYTVRRSNIIFDVGTVYHSSTEKLLTAYVGYNIGLGYSYGSYVHAEYNKSVSLSNIKDLNKFELGAFKVENTTTTNNFIGSLSLNWGFNLRLAKTRKFWSRIMINGEFRSGWTGEYIPRYGNYIRASLGGHFGLKILL